MTFDFFENVCSLLSAFSQLLGTSAGLCSLPKIIDSSLARALASHELPWVQPVRSQCTCMGHFFWSNPGLNPHPLLVAVLLLKPFQYTKTWETLWVQTEAKKGRTASALPLFTISISPEFIVQIVSLHWSLDLETKNASEYGWVAGMNYLLSADCGY